MLDGQRREPRVCDPRATDGGLPAKPLEYPANVDGPGTTNSQCGWPRRLSQ